MSEVVWDKGYYIDGGIEYESPRVNGKIHGMETGYYPEGVYISGEFVTEEQWRQHELITQLAGLDE